MANPRFKDKYHKEVVPALKEKFGYKSVMQVPRLEKICINQGVGSAVANKKLIDIAVDELSAIAGQRARMVNARKSISNFKLRAGMPIAVSVTLHGNRMYEFLDRLVTLALPRERDFRGISARQFDGRGNYNLGIKEQIIFPEISMDQVNRIVGMNITFVTSAMHDEGAYQLLKALGMPFRDNFKNKS